MIYANELIIRTSQLFNPNLYIKTRFSQIIKPLLAAATLSAAAPLFLPLEDPSFISTPALPTASTAVQSLATASRPVTIVFEVQSSRRPITPATTMSALQSVPATDNPVPNTTIVQSASSVAPTVISVPSFARSQPPSAFTTSIALPKVSTAPVPSANPTTFTPSVAAPLVPVYMQAQSGVPNAVSTVAY